MATAPRTYSFEFYPPKTPEALARLRGTVQQLGHLHPTFFSVTYGAGGSTREGTLATVLQIRDDGFAAAPHISCIAQTRESVRQVIGGYREHGIRHTVALRGDMPSGLAAAGDFRYASDLVRFIREETGDWFHIEVAAYPEYHPQARKPQDDLKAFKAKIDAGANAAITQYFYNADAYFHFVDQARAMGISVPIVPGIMPITNLGSVERMTALSGASFPPALRAELDRRRDDPAAIVQLGVAQAAAQCADLLAGGAPGIHFYTLNQSPASRMILTALKSARLA
jgi:methylenetetrahydrofolate reductase (NADPH)